MWVDVKRVDVRDQKCCRTEVTIVQVGSSKVGL